MLKQRAAPKHGIRNPETETESEYGIKYQRKKIKEFHIAQFSTIQAEFVLVFLAVPLNIFLLLCLDKVCRIVGYCTARPMKVILRVIYGLNNTVKHYHFS